MKTPQIILLVIMGAGLLLSAHDHGKPRSDNNFWVSMISGLIIIGLLIWGGFFK